jgi:hypothetical protein
VSLRGIVLAIGAAALAGGLAALLLGACPPALVFAGWGLVILVGTLAERICYKRLLRAPGAGWRRTPERFIDPQSGQTVTVYDDPATGERQYVQE